MLSISARSATASDIRAYLEGERDGANRGAEDYYAESGHTHGRWLGKRRRRITSRRRSERASLRSLSRRSSIRKAASPSCNAPANTIGRVGT